MKPTQDNSPLGSSSTLYCDLSAMSPEQRQRRAWLAERLGELVMEVIELPDGYAFRLDRKASTSNLMQELADLEQKCCPFLRFAQRTAPAGDPIIEVRGEEGAKAIIAGEMGLKIAVDGA